MLNHTFSFLILKTNYASVYLSSVTDVMILMAQNDDPSGPNIDLAPGSLQDKKMEAEKRGMGMNDYNGDMRKGGRGGGMAYRPPGSKEAVPGDAGSYYDKVTPHHLPSVFVSYVLSR